MVNTPKKEEMSQISAGLDNLEANEENIGDQPSLIDKVTPGRNDQEIKIVTGKPAKAGKKWIDSNSNVLNIQD